MNSFENLLTLLLDAGVDFTVTGGVVLILVRWIFSARCRGWATMR